MSRAAEPPFMYLALRVRRHPVCFVREIWYNSCIYILLYIYHAAGGTTWLWAPDHRAQSGEAEPNCAYISGSDLRDLLGEPKRRNPDRAIRICLSTTPIDDRNRTSCEMIVLFFHERSSQTLDSDDPES